MSIEENTIELGSTNKIKENKSPFLAKEELGWSSKTSLKQLCQIMVENDIINNKKNEVF